MAGPAVNYYLGLKRADGMNPDLVLAVSNVSAGPGSGTAADVELRIQINDGSNNTGITRKDVITCIEILEAFVNSGSTAAGAFLPAT